METLAGSSGHFVHRINPILFELGGVKIWYYGLIYALGFLGVHLWFRCRKKELNWSTEEVYDLSLLTTLCVLLFGHAFEVIVYEWSFYRNNPSELWKYWHGGMASHGVLIGGIFGVWLFSLIRKRRFLDIADEIVIPATFFLAIGRIGNFINGENFGPVTDIWWAVQFPYAEGFRHPSDLYDSLKNFCVLAILFTIRKRPPIYKGKLLSHFLFWYGFLRLIVDIFREYGSYFQGLGRGQYFNFLTALAGIILMFVFFRKRQENPEPLPLDHEAITALTWKRVAFSSLLLFSLTIPSGWSQGWLNQLR